MLNPEGAPSSTEELALFANNIKSISISPRLKKKQYTPNLQIGFQQKIQNFLPICPSARTSSVRTNRKQEGDSFYMNPRRNQTSHSFRKNDCAQLSYSMDLKKNENGMRQKEREKSMRMKELERQLTSRSPFLEFREPLKEEKQGQKKFYTSWKVRTGSQARKNRSRINWECDVVVMGRKLF